LYNKNSRDIHINIPEKRLLGTIRANWNLPDHIRILLGRVTVYMYMVRRTGQLANKIYPRTSSFLGHWSTRENTKHGQWLQQQYWHCTTPEYAHKYNTIDALHIYMYVHFKSPFCVYTHVLIDCFVVRFEKNVISLLAYYSFLGNVPFPKRLKSN